MLCEKCGRETESVACGGCGRTVGRLGPFCYYCGHRIGQEAEHEAPPADAGETDFESRVLCSDGTCIGVVGEDGRCKVCGKPYAPEP